MLARQPSPYVTALRLVHLRLPWGFPLDDVSEPVMARHWVMKAFLALVEQPHIDTMYEHKHGPICKYHMSVLRSSVVTHAMHTMRYDFISEVFAQRIIRRP